MNEFIGCCANLSVFVPTTKQGNAVQAIIHFESNLNHT